MSFLQTQAVGLIGTLIGNVLKINPSRTFSDFSDFCSVSETHAASVQPTQYPIENGTQGTDHIIKNPDTLTWDVLFNEQSNPQDTYTRLHDLLTSGVPFEASTGLKTYENLLLTGLSATTDAHTGRVLRASLTMQEIIITEAVSTTLPPRAQQKSANVTGSTAQSGTKQVKEARTSDIKNMVTQGKKATKAIFG
jgi:hypothetical protein